MNQFRAQVGVAKLTAYLSVLVLAYVADALIGWPVEWWVPIWALLFGESAAYVVASAWGLAFTRSQLAVTEQFGEAHASEEE